MSEPIAKTQQSLEERIGFQQSADFRYQHEDLEMELFMHKQPSL